MSLGEIIRTHRESLGLTQDQLAGRVGISKPYLSNIETGKTRNPPTDGVLMSLERSLGMPAGPLIRMAHLTRTPSDVRAEHEALRAEVRQLRGWLGGFFAGRGPEGLDTEALSHRWRQEDADGPVPAGVAAPVINDVAEGYPRRFTGPETLMASGRDFVRCPDLHDPLAFAVRVVGDAMAPAYREGDVVVVSPRAPVRQGSDCFVQFRGPGETVFLRYYADGEERVRLQPIDTKYPARVCRADEIAGRWAGVFLLRAIV